MLGLEKRISKQQDLIMKQSTTIMRLRETGAPSEQIEKEQKTLERMKIGLQGLLRSFSFSQVEARTTMVKAATEMQEIAGGGWFGAPAAGGLHAEHLRQESHLRGRRRRGLRPGLHP
jgi:hypothetical protein